MTFENIDLNPYCSVDQAGKNTATYKVQKYSKQGSSFEQRPFSHGNTTPEISERQPKVSIADYREHCLLPDADPFHFFP